MPSSMTGFARLEEQQPWGQLICEVRSVNHRYLEPNFRLSESLRSVEVKIRDQLRKRLGRGKVEIVLALKVDEASGQSNDFNKDIAKEVIEMAQQIGDMMHNPAALNALDVLRWPGVIQTKELDQKQLERDALALFDTTLKQMIENRKREGEELKSIIEERLKGIHKNVALVREAMPNLLSAQEEKIRSKIEALQVEVDEERLTQELVYLAQKADVAEELDRLEAHIIEVTRTLNQKEPIGRRLDFLMQELNREANTLSSKSIASECTQAAVEIKVLIEQMREQVQNIE